MNHKVIGIDLGTTYSAVAAYDDAAMTAVIIADEKGNDTTPSVVGIDPASGLVIVGAVAKRNAAMNPSNTIIEIKREMGELFTEASIDRFNARSGLDGKTFKKDDAVHVHFNNRWMLPQEISAFTLMRMASIAQQNIGQEIRDAVITVPAYFAANQRKATEDAALLAGLYPRQLIPEPTAAAICYGVDSFDSEQHVYLVYDLGGGTFDVSIIKVKESAVDVIATSGDRRLGGGDFDDALAYWALQEAKKQGLDVTNNPVARAIVKLAAEDTKIILSIATSANIIVADPVTKRAVTLTIDRPTFEQLIDTYLQRSLTWVTTALQDAAKKGIPREAIDAILLVGGSTKIPRVRQLLLEHFNRDEAFVRFDANPDQLVARGAAMLANKFEPSPPPFDIKRRPSSSLMKAEIDIPITLITEYTLGVGVQNDEFDPLITRGTSIPVSIVKTYTNQEGAPNVIAPIYQGEGMYVYENTYIGELKIGPIQPAPAGYHQFETKMSLDQNGLLSVTVNHKNEGKTYAGDFKHKTTVGGDDALIAMRQRLVTMFQPIPVYEPAIPPPPAPPAPTDAPSDVVAADAA
ncbi:MAG TPA: Hsp70 family protein, partial [Thermoanaerobaculia bacterium]